MLPADRTGTSQMVLRPPGSSVGVCCCNIRCNLQSFSSAFLCLWTSYHSNVLASESPKTLPLVRCQGTCLLWTCSAPYRQLLSSHEISDLYTENLCRCETMGAHLDSVPPHRRSYWRQGDCYWSPQWCRLQAVNSLFKIFSAMTMWIFSTSPAILLFSASVCGISWCNHL